VGRGGLGIMIVAAAVVEKARSSSVIINRKNATLAHHLICIAASSLVQTKSICMSKLVGHKNDIIARSEEGCLLLLCCPARTYMYRPIALSLINKTA
jgi:hypothetical protein